jgi:hypothetical protein
MMAELVFRGVKKLPFTQSSDTVVMKQYWNQHQEEVKKELEALKKLEPVMKT